MSNYIDKYKKEVRLIETILNQVNVTQAERIGRIYNYAFIQQVYSDQDFFEAVNWYAKKCIRVAAERSLRCSRFCNIDGIRYWNSVIIALAPLLGDHPWYDVEKLISMHDDIS